MMSALRSNNKRKASLGDAVEVLPKVTGVAAGIRAARLRASLDLAMVIHDQQRTLEPKVYVIR